MGRHVLSLEAPDTRNECILRLVDTSVYDPNLPVTCPKLQITPPGFNQYFVIEDVEPGFSLNITACDIGIQTVGCGTSYTTLVDGIYILRWSVAPNEYVYAEYNHLRVTSLLNKLYKVLCSLDVSDCEPDFKVKEKLKELRFIEMMIKAAKAAVEYCHNPRRGMDIYNFAKKRLDKFSCKSC